MVLQNQLYHDFGLSPVLCMYTLPETRIAPASHGGCETMFFLSGANLLLDFGRLRLYKVGPPTIAINGVTCGPFSAGWYNSAQRNPSIFVHLWGVVITYMLFRSICNDLLGAHLVVLLRFARPSKRAGCRISCCWAKRWKQHGGFREKNGMSEETTQFLLLVVDSRTYSRLQELLRYITFSKFKSWWKHTDNIDLCRSIFRDDFFGSGHWST